MSDFDFKKLRDDLADYYGTAAFLGMPAAFLDASRIEFASNEELLREASKNGFDLDEYNARFENNKAYSYFCDFDVKVGDNDFVSVKMAGMPGEEIGLIAMQPTV